MWTWRCPPTPAHAPAAPERVALAGAAAPTPCACGRRACSGVRPAARCPPPLRTWERHVGLHRTGDHLRTRAGHQRRAPGAHPRLPTDRLLPPATPCGLLTPGTDANASTVRGEAASGSLTSLRRRLPVGPPPDPACEAVQRSPHTCGAGHEAQRGPHPHGTDGSRRASVRAAAHPSPDLLATARGGATRPRTRREQTASAPDTGGGGILAPPSARLPTDTRRAEPNAGRQAPPMAEAT